MQPNQALRRAVLIVALLNLGYFLIEVIAARSIGSVSLLADSIDFLEDASLNFLILIALGWRPRWRARIGRLLAIILLIPSLLALIAVFEKLSLPIPPDAAPLSLAGLGALAVNLTCAFLLARFRAHRGSLAKAAFLSARNDAIANVAIIGAGIVTAATVSMLPDLVVGIGILLMNADAARQVWSAARRETQPELMPAE
jgi:Co/Zn/Cd efflux system component